MKIIKKLFADTRPTTKAWWIGREIDNVPGKQKDTISVVADTNWWGEVSPSLSLLLPTDTL